MLRLQHRPDGWYLRGFIGNEMNKHYSATWEAYLRSLRFSEGNGVQSLRAITRNCTQSSLTGGCCRGRLSPGFLRSRRAWALETAMGMEMRRYAATPMVVLVL